MVQEKLRGIASNPMKLPNNISDLAPCEFGLSTKELDEIRAG